MHCILYNIYQNSVLCKAAFKLYKKDEQDMYSIEYR